jgi:ABC-type taurine transport system substrate-binding protein
LLAIAKKIMENVDWRHLTTGSSGLTGQARSQLNRMLVGRTLQACALGKVISGCLYNCC